MLRSNTHWVRPVILDVGFAAQPIEVTNYLPILSSYQVNYITSVLQKKSGDVCLNADDLLRLEKAQVVVLKLPPPLKTRFLFNQMPSISVSKCTSCNKVRPLGSVLWWSSNPPRCSGVSQRRLRDGRTSRRTLSVLQVRAGTIRQSVSYWRFLKSAVFCGTWVHM